MKNGEELMALARQARLGAYAPYSGFCVGAALECADGRVFTGCNIENAAYSVTNCAERTALFKAVSEGAREFTAIAIAGARRGEEPDAPCAPCGVCRQALAEFCDPAVFVVYLAAGGQAVSRSTLQELLPHAFTPKNLEG